MYKECRPLASVQYEQHILHKSAKIRKKNGKILQVRGKRGMDSFPLKLSTLTLQYDWRRWKNVVYTVVRLVLAIISLGFGLYKDLHLLERLHPFGRLHLFRRLLFLMKEKTLYRKLLGGKLLFLLDCQCWLRSCKVTSLNYHSCPLVSLPRVITWFLAWRR